MSADILRVDNPELDQPDQFRYFFIFDPERLWVTSRTHYDVISMDATLWR